MVEVVEVGVLEQVRHGHAVQLSGGCKKQIIVQKTDTRRGEGIRSNSRVPVPVGNCVDKKC